MREHFAATKGGVQRRVDAVLPALAFLKGREAAERLREGHAKLGPALQLRAWLAGELSAEVVDQLLEAVAETDDQKAIRLRLNLDFAAFGRTLAELGYPPMNDEADFHRLFSAYLAELAPSIRARLRRAFLPAWRAAASLDEYVTLRTLEFIQFDSQWPLQLRTRLTALETRLRSSCWRFNSNSAAIFANSAWDRAFASRWSAVPRLRMMWV